MYYLAEFYLPGSVDLPDLARHARAAAEGVGGSSAATFRYAIHVPEDENCFAVYEAKSAESVAAAGTLAGLTFDRITAAILAGGDAP